MTGHKKKIVAFLATIALGSGGLVALSIQPTTEGAESDSKFQAGSVFTNDPKPSTKTTDNSAVQELFFKTMLAVLLVIVLGVAAIVTCRKLLPRITNLPGKQIRILETVHLGPRKAVHLIEIGNQQGPCSTGVKRLLIGITNESIAVLADVTGAITEFQTPEVEGSHFATDYKMGTLENDARI